MFSPNQATDHARRRRAGIGVAGVAFAFTAVMSFMTVPTPLYGLYSARNDFGEFTVTVIFAAYGAGVLIGLLSLGHISDHIGRKPVLLAASAAQIACAVAFALFTGTWALIVLRFVTGIGVGAFSTAATAALTELYARWRPNSSIAPSRTIANVANLGGLAVGPVIAGATAEATESIVAPYVLYAPVLCAALLALLIAPESTDGTARNTRWRYRPQTVRVDAHVRTPFLGAALAAAAGFAVLGFITALTGRFLAHITTPSPLMTGVVASSVLAGGIVSQLLFSRSDSRSQLIVGGALMTIGPLIIGSAAITGTLPLYLVGGFLAAGGNGLAFSSAVATVLAIAPAASRSGTLAALFVAAYAGTTIPVVAIGALLIPVEFVGVTVGFALLIAVAVPIGIGLLVRRTQPQRDTTT